MIKFYINGFSAFSGDVSLEQFTPYVETRRLRRMETMAKNALFCSYQALEQAALPLHEPKNMALSVAVGAGSLENTCKFMDSILDDGDELSSPTAFAGSVHNSTGLVLSLFLHTSGPCITTGQFEASFPAALLTAISFLHKGACEQALVVVAEDINGVAQTYAPLQPQLFTNLLRNPQGPFIRATASFVIGTKPLGNNPFAVNRVEFTRTEQDSNAEYGKESAFTALETVRLLKKGQAFILEDSFGGAQFTLEATAYVKP